MRTLIALALLCVPAYADECLTVDRLKDAVAKDGAEVLATLPVKTDHLDAVVLVQGTDALTVWGFKDGCSVGFALMDSVTTPRLDKGVPA